MDDDSKVLLLLRRLGIDQYAALFADNGIDARALGLLTETDLKDMGLLLGHRRILLAAIKELGDEKLPDATAGHAGTPAAESPGERRQVTVLFADLTGFTAITSGRDAEETHLMLNRYFATVDAVIAEHGGTIDKHIGDAAMAVFGAPVAHTNDPERAVRAALRIIETVATLEPPLRAHIGIASGQVVASGTGSDAYREYTMTGESVNLASRLTELAGPGEIFISDPVRAALVDWLDVEALGARVIKGLARPVKVWRMIGIRGQSQAGPRRMVGRKAELRQFEGMLDNALETGSGQVIRLRGEAGIGKTRLVTEFQRLAEAKGFTTYGGFVLDFGASREQDPICGLVRSLLDRVASGSDTASAAEQAYTRGYLDRSCQVYLNDLLDLPQPPDLLSLYVAMDNATRNRGKQKTVSDLVRGVSASVPLMLTIEDVQWAGTVTLAHLGSLAAVVRDCPVVLVMTSRFDGDPIDQAWRVAAGSPLVTFDLGPLREVDALKLAAEYLEASNDFARKCVQRAEGNPLFLDQLLRNAEEMGEVEVPGSVQGLVLARMDRLEPVSRAALQTAAVIGQRFTQEVLRHMLDDKGDVCPDLVEHLFIRSDGEGYVFAHALVRDAVYASLLGSRRRDLHRRAAGWFAERDPTLHAEHLGCAGDPAATLAYLRAARAQAAIYRYENALQLTERGLAIAVDHQAEYELTCFRGDILRDLGDPLRSIEAFTRALDVADDEAQKCRPWIGLAAAMRIVDRYDDALDALERAEAVATRHARITDLAHIHYYRGNIYFPLGNFDGCLKQHGLARQLAQQAETPEYEAQALGGLGDAYFLSGRMITAHSHFQRCIEICQEHGFRRIEIANLHMLGETRIYKNELQQALRDCEAAAEPAARIGHYRAELATRCVMAYLLLDMGKLTEAEQQCDHALAIARRLGARRFEALALLYAGILAMQRGDCPNAAKLLRSAIVIGRESGITYSGPWALGALAMVTSDRAERSRALNEGEALLRQDCVSHNQFWFYRYAMESCLQSGDWQEVDRFATALELFARPEPLPWSDFFVARGRALATSGRCKCDDATVTRIAGLLTEARRVGLTTAIPALEAALGLA